MALCNQCAEKYWSMVGDIPPGTVAACDGCGICITDEKGDCISGECFEHHNLANEFTEVFVEGDVQPYKVIRIPSWWWWHTSAAEHDLLARLHGGNHLRGK